MGKVELRWGELRVGDITLVDLAERYSQSWVVLRRTAVVDVLGPGGKSHSGQGQERDQGLHLDVRWIKRGTNN